MNCLRIVSYGVIELRIQKNKFSSIILAFAMLLLIFDAKTAAYSSQIGIRLCLQTVIPSLFPFFVISGLLNSRILGQKFFFLNKIGSICRVPKGAESLLLLSFLAGYPMGAQMITQAYQQGSLSKTNARRMLGFCNNAGPAFIFGMLAPYFPNAAYLWGLWGIQIGSALLVGMILPAEESDLCDLQAGIPCSVPQALQNAIKSMATVCGWVIVFRIIIGFFDRWFLWVLPSAIKVILSGVLELTNGCVMLDEISSTTLRFILISFLLSFGGLCVGMQTVSVTQKLGIGYYFPGKVLQALISILLSGAVCTILFSEHNSYFILIYSISIILTIGMLYFIRGKKVVAFGRKMIYNTNR